MQVKMDERTAGESYLNLTIDRLYAQNDAFDSVYPEFQKTQKSRLRRSQYVDLFKNYSGCHIHAQYDERYEE